MLCLRVAAVSIAALATILPAHADDVVTPNANLKAEGVPPIPATLAAGVAPYTEFKPTFAVDWYPDKRELIVARRAGNVVQLHQVAAPAAASPRHDRTMSPSGTCWRTTRGTVLRERSTPISSSTR